MPALLLDLDGVFYKGDRAIEGAAEAMEWIRRHAISHLFITNTTSRDRWALVEKLAGFGIAADVEQILTPPVAAVSWLHNHITGSVALFVPEAIRSEFTALPEAGSDEADEVGAVVMGDLGPGWDFATLNRAFRLLMRTPQPYLVALGMTRYWRAEDGLRLDTAPFVAALQHASGVEPVVLGKPSPDFYRTALERLGARPEQTLIVGDDIRSDIEGAQNCGIRGVLVKTGKFRPADLASDIKPDAVLDSIADLPRWWEKKFGIGN